MNRRAAVSEAELRSALIILKREQPTLGVSKIHALLLDAHPTWAISEKRVRKILQSEHQNNGHPVSHINTSLDVAKWTSKVKVHYFGAFKGKGLVATERISEGQVLWKEDPFILAPEWDIYNLQRSSRACEFCSTPLGNHSPLHLPCTATPCPAMFCNRLCRAQADKVHPLLCPARNPASIALLEFARGTEWMALHALAQCTSKLLLAAQRDDGTLDDDLAVVHGLAKLGMEERFRALGETDTEPDRESWQHAHALYLAAFQSPPTPDAQKKLARILTRPTSLPLFSYDAFLHGLGRMSLNLEAHGGLYRLHSHLNHACEPNTSVRHFDQRTALARITVVARTAIEPGEELLITYVDPRHGYRERRKRLLEWGFGPCQCGRCLVEATASGTYTEAEELADQLKAGLGLN